MRCLWRTSAVSGWSSHNFVMSKFTRAVQRKFFDQSGDVPGWVLVTLMTAALVVALWFLAWPAFEGLFNDSIDNMTNVG